MSPNFHIRELSSKVFIGYAPRAVLGKNAYIDISSSLRPIPSAEVADRVLKRYYYLSNILITFGLTTVKRAEAMPGTAAGPFYIAVQQGINHVLKGLPFLLMLLYKLCSIPNHSHNRIDPMQQRNLQIAIDCFIDIMNVLGNLLK